MTNYFIIPGLGNSGEAHWQTFFEKSLPDIQKINQQDWETPKCIDWIETIDKTISGYDLSTVILIGHSLGCAAINWWANHYKKKIKGALLVAPSDAEAPQYTFATEGFTPIPLQKISFKTIVVASTNDYWLSLERAKFFAESWGSEFINIGNAGHINAEAGYGKWEQGLEILEKLK
ncbi:MAG: alpha/beta hydrolase [Chitinophagaceae bacterium]|jgi:predicted alpha/beta hydrolase family esterase|nr:alpha/beta hydrolase [Chitinophagaceae bacterium]